MIWPRVVATIELPSSSWMLSRDSSVSSTFALLATVWVGGGGGRWGGRCSIAGTPNKGTINAWP